MGKEKGCQPELVKIATLTPPNTYALIAGCGSAGPSGPGRKNVFGEKMENVKKGGSRNDVYAHLFSIDNRSSYKSRIIAFARTSSSYLPPPKRGHQSSCRDPNFTKY